MRRLALMLACCGLFQLLTPTPAHAWYEWIDQLSGPGSFSGTYIRYRFACFGPSAEKPRATIAEAPNNQSVPLTSDSFSKTERVVLTAVGSGCLFQPTKTPLVSVNVKVGKLISKHNELPYDRPVDTTIGAWQFELTNSYVLDRSTRRLELTAGFGWTVYSGEAFKTFSRLSVPVTLAYTPFATRDRSNNRIARAISVFAGVVVDPEGVNAGNFGAGGDFQTDGEVRPTFGVILDLTR